MSNCQGPGKEGEKREKSGCCGGSHPKQNFSEESKEALSETKKSGCCGGSHSKQNFSEEGKEALSNSNGGLNSESEIEQCKKDVAEYKDKYLRQLAEMENMRRRLHKERQELVQHAMQNVIVEFLNPIDHMENALKHTQQMSDEVKNWAIGFQMILSQFKDILSEHGVVSFTSEGTPFDPHHHEAIELMETTEHPSGTVVSESIRGYKMDDRTIRPARVIVAKAPEERPSAEDEKNKKV